MREDTKANARRQSEQWQGWRKSVEILRVMEDQKEADGWSETELLSDLMMMAVVTRRERSQKGMGEALSRCQVQQIRNHTSSWLKMSH